LAQRIDALEEKISLQETAWAEAHPDMERPVSSVIFRFFIHFF